MASRDPDVLRHFTAGHSNGAVCVLWLRDTRGGG